MKKTLIISLAVVAYITAGYFSMPLSYCSASELATIYGGAKKCVCTSYNPCTGCSGNCTGASNGTICGSGGTSTAWTCTGPIEGGGGCNPGPGDGAYGKKCTCSDASCTQTEATYLCATAPLTCSTD